MAVANTAPVPAALLAMLLPLLAVGAEPMNFTVFSRPVKLRYGEVYNTMQMPMKLPADVINRYADGKTMMAVIGFDVDMVRISADGSESRVKLNDHYLHHYILEFGQAATMQKMLDAASGDEKFARMLSSCHGMTRVGVHTFVDRLQMQHPGERYDFAMFGSASGAEYRDNLQRTYAPFRRILRQPEVWAPILHIINTNSPAEEEQIRPWSPLLECPCTPQRKIDVAAGTIDGHAPDPPIKCSPEFAATGNPSCHLATYQGGWRCCEHGVFVIDTDKECKLPDCSDEPQDEVFMKFTFLYEDAQSDTRPTEPAACCDVTSATQGDENIEYDVPACPQGTPPEQCIHVAEGVAPLAYFLGNPKAPLSIGRAGDLVDLVFAAPHLHLAGMSIELIDDVTNETICKVYRTPDNSGGIMYGHGSQPGDENGYMVGLTPCIWGGSNASRFRRDHPMRTRAIYNASIGHTGVMSLWLMEVAAVRDPDFLV